MLAAFGQNLDQPAGVAVDAAGHVWVADTGHGRVVEFSSAGRVLAAFGAAGSGRERLNQPVALAVTPSGDVWVADQGNGRVVEFSADGRYRVSFAVPTPAGVGLDARGDVWVSSPGYALTGGNSVREFSPAGHQLRSFGITQAGYGDLEQPGRHRGRAGRPDLRRAAGLRAGVRVQPGRELLHRVRPAAGPGPGGRGPGVPAGPGDRRDRAGLGGRHRARPDRPVRQGARLSRHRRAGCAGRAVAPADRRRVPARPGHRRPRLVPGPARPSAGARGHHP